MKLQIINRARQKIAVQVEGPKDGKQLAFVMHGLGGNMNEPHIRAVIQAFLTCAYTVVSWDAVHTFGESTGGKFEDATVTNYYADLEDVIAWTSEQEWYCEPFILAGHSLGGIATALYAERHPEKVIALAPLSTVISGRLSMETKESDFEAWQREGMRITKRPQDGSVARLKWSHMEDRLGYDLLPQVARLTMPVLLIVGEKDVPTPIAHQQLLFERLPGPKELHIVRGSPHVFYKPQWYGEVQRVIEDWLRRL